MKQLDKEEKMPALNERLHASGGVFPQTVLWGLNVKAKAKLHLTNGIRSAACSATWGVPNST